MRAPAICYVPPRTAPEEPGDLYKFKSQSWHTNRNSCATHTPNPKPAGNNTLYWSASTTFGGRISGRSQA
ncbi:MAG: hypothetical protein KDI56_12825, partial [Xanthomonadales bacterium]|nr:hypothetical protein [Xanthomonadales bacterium]